MEYEGSYLSYVSVEKVEFGRWKDGGGKLGCTIEMRMSPCFLVCWPGLGSLFIIEIRWFF